MGSVYIFVIILTLSSHCLAYVVSHSETDRSIASVLLKEGQSAEISSMIKGTGDYFWRKGEHFNNSIVVASFIVGDVTDDSQRYSVTVRGTLLIRSVTLEDEGNYFCRVSSTENECYGEVKVLVQASLRNFDLAIDRCDGESSCLLHVNPSQFTSLTCTALNAPPLMTLKWFNGSKEITEGIENNEIIHQHGNSREITSTVAAVYGHPASLTCEAVDPKRSNDDVRFAHAQVEMTVLAHETLPSWIIVAVTLAGCFIIFGIYLLIKARASRKRRKKYKRSEEEPVELLKLSADAKDTEISDLKSIVDAKDTEISDLKSKLKQKEAEVKVKDNKNIELQGKLKQKEAEVKVKNNKNIELQALLEKERELNRPKEQKGWFS